MNGTQLEETGISVDDSDNVTGVNDLTVDGDFIVNGIATTINTATMDVEDANITVNKGGTEANADTNNAGITVEMSDAVDVEIGFDSTVATKFNIGPIGSQSPIVDEATAQTFTNKTIDADVNPISNLAHGAEVDDLASNVHGVTGDVVGTTDTQVITNKDIDGGTAANDRRITLPKDTTTNLDALTDKEGTVMYDTTLVKPVFNDGTNNIELATIADVSGGAANESSLLENHSIAAVAATGALTIDLETRAAATPSGGDAVRISHLNATLATGTYLIRSVAAALNIVIPSGATLGYANGDNVRVHVYSIDNAGAVELAVAGSRIFKESELHNTTTIDATADVGTTLFSTAGRTGVSIRYLGFIQVDAITAAGTWTAPDSIRLNQGQPVESNKQEISITAAQTDTSVADVYVDVAGSSMTLTPGKFEMGFDVALLLLWISGTPAVSANVAIRDASNVVQTNGISISTAILSSVFSAVRENPSRTLEVTVTATETFKLSVRSVDAAAVSIARLSTNLITGSLTDPDNASVFWSRRIEE